MQVVGWLRRSRWVAWVGRILLVQSCWIRLGERGAWLACCMNVVGQHAWHSRGKVVWSWVWSVQGGSVAGEAGENMNQIINWYYDGALSAVGGSQRRRKHTSSARGEQASRQIRCGAE